LAFQFFDQSLLYGASRLVPGNRRAEWMREWRAELWHVRQERAPMDQLSWQAEREIATFCIGAFLDAFCLGRHRWKLRIPLVATRGSAMQCILLLAVLMVVTYGIALLSPGVCAERMISPRPQTSGLMLIQDSENNSSTISPAQYQAWKSHKHGYFDDFAFYRVTGEKIGKETGTAGSSQHGKWRVAQASSNLLSLLGLPVQFVTTETKADSNLPDVILSEEVWKMEFGANPHIAGSVVRIGERKARVAGVAADDSWGLPGKAGAWILEPDPKIAAGGAGYVVAHLTGGGREKIWPAISQITEYGPDDTEHDYLGYHIDEWKPGPWGIYWFGLFLALISLPAITSVSLGEYSLNSQKTSWPRKLLSWSFLGAKIALLLPISYFASLDLSYLCVTHYSHLSPEIQLASTFFFCLFALRWALLDHRQRCPVCLRRVEHPAQVGLASRTFLAWNGTEMMCMGGHTLLHIPSLPTSWFDAQRWLYLDASWEFLFVGSSVG
jgi:hypothetical protein